MASYAARLSDYAARGKCGAPEITEGIGSARQKCALLAELIGAARKVVAFTGAGISTSAGIPDFRGPNGVWTIEDRRREARESENDGDESKTKKRRRRTEQLNEVEEVGDRSSTTVERKAEEQSDCFVGARPTFTHCFLAELEREGKLTCCVSQNVDGLHLRSGLPAKIVHELHGNMFLEVCEKCKESSLRDFDVGTISFAETGRACMSCGGKFRDTLLDWDDPLPDDALDDSEEKVSECDLCLVLGSSLQIVPARDIPFLRKGRKKRFVAIVNLQRTPKDRSADLVLKRRCDEVLATVLWEHGKKELSGVERKVEIALRLEGDKLVVSGGDGCSSPFIAKEAALVVLRKAFKENEEEQDRRVTPTTTALPQLDAVELRSFVDGVWPLFSDAFSSSPFFERFDSASTADVDERGRDRDGRQEKVMEERRQFDCREGVSLETVKAADSKEVVVVFRLRHLPKKGWLLFRLERENVLPHITAELFVSSSFTIVPPTSRQLARPIETVSVRTSVAEAVAKRFRPAAASATETKEWSLSVLDDREKKGTDRSALIVWEE